MKNPTLCARPPRFIKFAIFLTTLFALSSCREGDLGPVDLPLGARQSFEARGDRGSRLAMSKGQDTDSTLFYYDHSRRSLSLSVGTQHLLFRGVQFNIDAGLLISSPSASHVHDSRGLRVGAQITRRYLGGNTHVSYWDYRVQLFTEHNEVLASGTARVEELLNLDVRPR